jgi:hypothetical protein
MPIELGIWKLNGSQLTPERVPFSAPDLELHLETAIAQDLSIVAPNLLLIGRQVVTSWGKFIDILAMDGDGHLVVLELKRGKTPREVVAQALDYGSWVQGLSYEDIVHIFTEKNPGKAFESSFEERFGSAPPDVLNAGHRLIIVAARLDSETERIINYLTESYGVPVNAVFFHFFKDGGTSFLARTWLLDPQEAEVKVTKASGGKSQSEPWNGRDYYVNIGDDASHDWDDCRKYGFVAAGGGKWYSQSLHQLFPGARIFPYLPGKGYVGVGFVTGPVTPAVEWNVETPDGPRLLLDLPLQGTDMARNADDPDLREYIVPVNWLKTLPREEAYREKGMFAKQNTVCRLANAFTLERLVRRFELDGEQAEDTTAALDVTPSAINAI